MNVTVSNVTYKYLKTKGYKIITVESPILLKGELHMDKAPLKQFIIFINKSVEKYSEIAIDTSN